MTDTLLRDGSTTEDPRLGRLPQFDPASRAYQVRTLLTDPRSVEEIRGLRGKYHFPGPTLDQRREGQCVAEGCTDRRNGAPLRRRPRVLDFEERRGFYHAAQHRDPWPGCARGTGCALEPAPAHVEAYDGTSVLAGMLEGRFRGWWDSFFWIGAGSGTLEADVVDTLRQVGGIVLGIPWTESMYETTPSGLVEVSGREVGGHCIHAWEWAPRQRMPRHWTGTRPGVWWHNSWGDGYGVGRRGRTGCGFILLDDLMPLLENGRGEGAVPVA